MPSGRQVAQQIVVGVVTAVAVAWIIAHVPALKAWMKAQAD